ncbi:aldolase [Desarmillaria ectypa]|nr:aldolase [Desarmillaria ectypa]
MSESLKGNRTLEILLRAEREGYGVLAQICYDANSVIGLIRAAERSKSPTILQLFPVTLAYGKGPFLQFCLDAAHSASVPISVHLDHATDKEHLELAVGLAEQRIAFDSIMVDASHAGNQRSSIIRARPWVEHATKVGVAVEVELGRLEGGEAGLRMISGAKLTDPAKADAFIMGTGATILAPSIGNLHGSYINPPNFNQEILRQLRTTFKDRGIPICLHGTDELPDELFRECVKSGVSNFNVNSWGRDPYIESLTAGPRSKPFPDAVEEATEVFAKVCDRFFILFDSVGRYRVDGKGIRPMKRCILQKQNVYECTLYLFTRRRIANQVRSVSHVRIYNSLVHMDPHHKLHHYLWDSGHM